MYWEYLGVLVKFRGWMPRRLPMSVGFSKSQAAATSTTAQASTSWRNRGVKTSPGKVKLLECVYHRPKETLSPSIVLQVYPGWMAICSRHAWFYVGCIPSWTFENGSQHLKKKNSTYVRWSNRVPSQSCGWFSCRAKSQSMVSQRKRRTKLHRRQ